MHVPRTAIVGIGVTVAALMAWIAGTVLDGGPLDPALGFDPYLLAYFAVPAAATGITIMAGGFAVRRPIAYPWVWLLVPTAALAIGSAYLWAWYWRGFCCSA